MIYVYLQIVVCFLVVTYSFFYKKEKDILNPIYLYTLIHIYFFVMPPIFRVSLYYTPANFNNELAKIIGMIAYVSFIAGYFLPLRNNNSKVTSKIFGQKISVLSVLGMAVVTLAITALVFAYKITHFGGIRNVLKNSFEIMNTLSKGKWFLVVLGGIFMNSYYYFTAYVYGNIRGKMKWILIGLYLMLTIFISGIQARSTIVSLFIIFIIYENYKGRKIEIKNFLLLILVSIIGMFVLNLLRQGFSIREAFNFNRFLSSFMVDTNPYENLSVVLNQNPNERVYFKYLFLLPASFIPRIIWPGKPDTLFEAYLMNKYITYPVNGTMTFTLPGSLYFNIGIIGVLLGMILYGRIFRVIYTYLTQKKENLSYLSLMIYYIIVINLLNGYRFSVEGILQNMVFTFIVFIPFVLFNSYISKQNTKGKQLEDKISKWIAEIQRRF